MRPFAVLVLTACFLLISSASPVSEANSRNITSKHEKRKRMRNDSGILTSSEERSHIRNLEKHQLVFNKTMQIFGLRVQQILNDSKKWRLKHNSNKDNLDPIDLSRILKDRSSDGYSRTYPLSESDSIVEKRPSVYTRNNTIAEIGSKMYSEIKERVEQMSHKNSTFSLTDRSVSSYVSSKDGTKDTTVKSENRNYSSNLTSHSDVKERKLIHTSTIKTESSSSNYNNEGLLTDNIKVDDDIVSSEIKTQSDLIQFDLNYDLEMLNLSEYTSSSLSSILRDLLDRLSISNHETDDESTPPCQMWADCRWKLQEVLTGSLPSCPCTYPSEIFYDDSIWDNTNQRFYRWKDASGANERLDVYKPGAKHCIRSIASDLYSIAAQHCCYDKNHKLLTRGSGAGSPNLVSPDISPPLHYRIDILPWHHCKGDFTRYNKVRPPNNGNKCLLNPNEDEFQRQIEMATSF